MRISFKTLGFAALLAANSVAYADDTSAPAPAPAKSATPAAQAQAQAGDDSDGPSRGDHKYYVGVGLFNQIINLNGEVVTKDWGNFTLRSGRAKDKGNSFLTSGGWHHPLQGDDSNASGYYYGVFGGQIDQQSVGGKAFRLLGAGVDLGYHWVTTNTRSIISVGLGGTQKVSYGDSFRNTEPLLYFNVSIAAGR